MEWLDVQSFVTVLLALCGAIVCIGGAINLIRGWLKPRKETDARIFEMLERNKITIEKHNEEIDDIKCDIAELKRDNNLMLKMLLEMMNHEIDGNGIERMKKLRTEIQDELVNR